MVHLEPLCSCFKISLHHSLSLSLSLSLSPLFPRSLSRRLLSPLLSGTRARGKQKGVSFLPQTHLYHNGSDKEEERSLTNEDNSAEDLLGKPKKSLLWQRMKWTDDMVRLLISTVASVEDDGMHSLSTRLPPSISPSN